MLRSSIDRRPPSWLSTTLVGAVVFVAMASAEEIPVGTIRSTAESGDPVAATDNEELLQFSFSGTPWREVIQWLADEANLALHVGDVPTGSFTYSDPDLFTYQQAIDRVNLFLLPQGYTLVRSGKLLSVINLADPRSMQQLDALAEFITVQQLDEQNNHDVVKCLFPLGDLSAEDAVQELSALKLMSTPAVFAKTNQLMITDTAGKLKNVKAILDSFQPSQMDDGTVVKSFPLQHVNAEDVLLVARPHLGLATGEMIGIDVSLSSDLQGKNIFVTGVEDKVKLIEGLVKAIDQPTKDESTSSGEMELRSHLVEGGNVELVYNVLQTLLSGQSVRLSMDQTASSVVAFASPSVQTEIEQTVAQLQASEADFEVIPLKTVDPYFAISLLQQMLDLPDALDDPEGIDPDAPKIDADPASMRLFVRAKKPQIEQIKKIVAGLEENGSVDSSHPIRILPLKGQQAEQLLITAAKFWREDNPIIFYRSSIADQPQETERVVNGDVLTATSTALAPERSEPANQQLLTSNGYTQAPPIRCQVTPRGLLLQSDDSEALDRFEDQLRTIAGPVDSMPSPPIVFYLKFTKADDAIRMLAELLDGGESAGEFEGGSLVNGFVSPSGSFLGSIVTSRDGTTTMMAGSITVVADPRLNRLIAQGNASDIERIENYLKIIDKDNSITTIETYGTTHVIELANARASEVAVAVRDAFVGRVTGASSQPNQSGSPQQAQRDAAAAKENQANPQEAGKKSSEKKQAASQPLRNLEPQMTIAVHEPSNALIVTAPEQLFQEVEKLALAIDAQSQQTFQVIAPMNGELLESVLQRVLLGEDRPNGRSARPSPVDRTPSSSAIRTPSSSRTKSGG